MASSARPIPNPPRAVSATIANGYLVVDLEDGRSLSVPTIWYPRLHDSSAEELVACELILDGEGIHWPDIDEHISVEGLLAGRKSATGIWPGEPRKSERT